MTDRERRRLWTLLGVALAAATIYRVVLIDSIPDRSYFGKYQDFADALLDGTIARDRIPDLSPGYLWATALLRALGLGVHSIRTLQIILLSGVAASAARIAYVLRGDLAGVGAGVLILGSRAALVNATDLEPETLLLLFSAVGLMLVLSARRPALLAAGVAFGLATTCRPVALLGAGALLLWLALRQRRDAALFAAGLIVPIVTVLIVNEIMTGSVLLMDPGTVFYEGMNPQATGYGGVAPRIVKDIEPSIPGFDTMHVAYRLVAARAMHRPLSREEANRYWTGKALAFVRAYPWQAVRLMVRKVRLLISSHDAYDVPSMVLKERALGWLWIPWALLIPLAAYGAIDREQRPVLLFTICAAVSPIAFFVTARHRNPLLIGLAVLGGAGLAGLIERRAFLTSALIALVAVAFSIPGPLQREDDYLWTATFAVGEAMSRGDLATAATWLPESVPPAPPAALHKAALRELARTAAAERSFSIAVALLDAGDALPADEILSHLQSIGYRPFRRTRAVSSAAYYRARALLALQRPQEAREQIARAAKEAPGDADVLALGAFLDRDAGKARRLDRLHDPFTRDWALARAALAMGDRATARRLAERSAAGCPEWPPPRTLR